MPRKHRLLWTLGTLLLLLPLLLMLAAERFVEPVLRQRLEALVVQGSDSLYRFQLDRLEASLFGGSATLSGFRVEIDSSRYRLLREQKRLPAVTMRISMSQGRLRGVQVLSLLFGQRVDVEELFTRDARIEVWQQSPPPPGGPVVPLWRALRPTIKSISLNTLRLDGIRFRYRYADSIDMQVKFDTCAALIQGIRIDSVSAADPRRIAFAASVQLHFYDLKFRAPDSSFKLKAKVIDYNSDGQLLTIRDFKLQPTLKEKEAFYEAASLQREMTVIEFARLDLKRFRLEEFFNRRAIVADSLVVDTPRIRIYTDKTLPPTLEGKTGRYPGQLLLSAKTQIDIRHLLLRQAQLTYTEKAEKTGAEGTLDLDRLDLLAGNVTNLPERIKADRFCRLQAGGRILGAPIRAQFRFDLHSPDGLFWLDGSIGALAGGRLQALAEPLANIRLKALQLQQLRFSLQGDEYTARGSVWMRYRNLELVLLKRDAETGLLETKKFLTKLINRYTLLQNNPAPGAPEMMARNIEKSRLMTQSFFGLIWKVIFSGMQTIMTNTGEPVV